MCTTALQSIRAGQLVLACNRDELGTRQPAHPPTVHEFKNGLAAIFPRDRDAGGSWVGVNTSGIAVSLLNNYAADVRPLPLHPKSRGVIVPQMLQCRNLVEVEAGIESLRDDLERFRPFWLIVAEVPNDGPARAVRATWDGEVLTCEPIRMPMAQFSSSFEHERVEQSRRAQVESLLKSPTEWTAETTDTIFGSHLPTRGAASVCMHRDDGSTVSHTRIEINGEDIRMTYHDGPLCLAPQVTRLALQRL